MMRPRIVRLRAPNYTKPSSIRPRRAYSRPPFAPRPTLDLRHIRQNPGLYEQNCIDRNYPSSAQNGWKILTLHEQLVAQQRDAVEIRRRNNEIGRLMKGGEGKEWIDEARELKTKLADFERRERAIEAEIEGLAIELPNLSSLETPVGGAPDVIGYINSDGPVDSATRSHAKSHVDIGRDLDLLDFESSATTSGWGWYFLKNEGALLEQALIQYALSVAIDKGWKVMTPPSLVYAHIANACGFLPRDQNGETQVYDIAQDVAGKEDKAGLVLAGTAEIPFAGSKAGKTLLAKDLPLKIIGPSRCYRAEAGARGVETKGLYRVHEFTKVEMFAWTAPPHSTIRESDLDTGNFATSIDDDVDPSTAVLDELISIQTTILTALNLPCRILEQPTTDLGASATRKIDIEAFFPSRTGIDGGYGEVTSASICTDYQSRRLGTKVGKQGFAHTVNGTAVAVPRVLAAILENGWDGEGVVVPEVLRKWMPGGLSRILQSV